MESLPQSKTVEDNKKSIIACLYDEPTILNDLLNVDNVIDFVDMNMLPEQQKDGFVGEFREKLWAYIISPIDSRDKLSLKYAECTGIIIVGIDKETGENISFLSHQNPSFFLLYDDLKFFDELKKRVQEIRDRCEPDSIDAVIFGGKFSNVKYFSDDHPIHKIDKELYLKSVEYISTNIKSILGFDPEIISGPKFNPAYDHVFFANKYRRLHLIRPSNEPDFTRNFKPNDIDLLSESWKPGKWTSSNDDINKNKNS